MLNPQGHSTSPLITLLFALGAVMAQLFPNIRTLNQSSNSVLGMASV